MTLLPRGWAVAVLLSIPALACADVLEVDLGLEGNIVKVKAKHEDETPAKGVKVTLVDDKLQLVASGKINADGEWSWPAPAPGNYEVVLDAGPGEKEMRLPIQVKGVALPSPEPSADRVKCEHCPTAPQQPVGDADEGDENHGFPWLPTSVALGFIGSCGLIWWVSRFCCRPTPG
jgi:hypothetical protein